MKLNRIISLANASYPIRGQINRHWDRKNQRPIDMAAYGLKDHLALFIVKELVETYDPDGTSLQQARTASVVIDKSIEQLESIRNRFNREVASKS